MMRGLAIGLTGQDNSRCSLCPWLFRASGEAQTSQNGRFRNADAHLLTIAPIKWIGFRSFDKLPDPPTPPLLSTDPLRIPRRLGDDSNGTFEEAFSFCSRRPASGDSRGRAAESRQRMDGAVP